MRGNFLHVTKFLYKIRVWNYLFSILAMSKWAYVENDSESDHEPLATQVRPKRINCGKNGVVARLESFVRSSEKAQSLRRKQDDVLKDASTNPMAPEPVKKPRSKQKVRRSLLLSITNTVL